MCLYLPRHRGDTKAAELADAPRADAGQTVLVMHDELTVRMPVTEVLEDFVYTAIEAADGPTGLKALRSDVRIGLLMTGAGLPGGMNGRQVADAARVEWPNLKVLFITGYARNAVLTITGTSQRPTEQNSEFSEFLHDVRHPRLCQADQTVSSGNSALWINEVEMARKFRIIRPLVPDCLARKDSHAVA